MGHSSVAHPLQSVKSLPRKRLWIAAAVAVAAGVLGVAVFFINAHWPYRYRVVKPLLEDVLGGQVQISRYHRTYFPRPGFAATGITLRRKTAPNLPPLGSVDTLFVQGSWIDLLMLRERIELVDMTGVHILVPVPQKTSIVAVQARGIVKKKDPVKPLEGLHIQRGGLVAQGLQRFAEVAH